MYQEMHMYHRPPDQEKLRIANRLVVSPTNGYIVCTLCDKQFYSMEYAGDHIESKSHKAKLAKAQWVEFTSNPDNGVMGNPTLGVPPEIECRGDDWFSCRVCFGQTLWDTNSVQAHCRKPPHKAALASCGVVCREKDSDLPLARGSVPAALSSSSAPSPQLHSARPPSQPVAPEFTKRRTIPPPPVYTPDTQWLSREETPSVEIAARKVGEELPTGFAYSARFASTDSKQRVIECEVCGSGSGLFGSIVEAWRHSLSDRRHLMNMKRKVDSVFKLAYKKGVPENQLFCEPCGESILDPTHFTSPSHVEFVTLMTKFGQDYFQPFRDGDSVHFFSWRNGVVITASSVPSLQLLHNNPQLLHTQWLMVKHGLPTPDWPLSNCPVGLVRKVMDAIPRDQLEDEELR